MELRAEANLLLRESGYRVWPWQERSLAALGFEDSDSIGFLFVLPTASQLLESHNDLERAVLSSYSLRLRSAGEKAWNIYTVFLTAEIVDRSTERAILQIEEDLQLTRKIARAAISSGQDLRIALLPLLPITSQPDLSDARYTDRVQKRLSSVMSANAVTAFVGEAPAFDIVQMLLRENMKPL
jgi:hypothetical protein